MNSLFSLISGSLSPGAMCAVIIIFALMSIFYYEYNYYTQEKKPDFASDDEDLLPNNNVKMRVSLSTTFVFETMAIHKFVPTDLIAYY